MATQHAPAPGSPSFVGRAAELEAFAQVYGGIAQGRGRTMLVSGEAGIGKSRFLAEARAHVEDSGGRFLQGNCFEQDSSLPLGPSWTSSGRCSCLGRGPRR